MSGLGFETPQRKSLRGANNVGGVLDEIGFLEPRDDYGGPSFVPVWLDEHGKPRVHPLMPEHAREGQVAWTSDRQPDYRLIVIPMDATFIERTTMRFMNWIATNGGQRAIERLGGQHGTLSYRYYIIETRWFGICLHNFLRSDHQVPHDHPRDNLSIPLTGYDELQSDGKTVRRVPAWRFVWRPAERAHAVKLWPGRAGRTLSLFITFRRRREWGFLLPKTRQWIHYKEYSDQYLGGAVASATGKNATIKIVGWFFPKVVRLDAPA